MASKLPLQTASRRKRVRFVPCTVERVSSHWSRLACVYQTYLTALMPRKHTTKSIRTPLTG